MTNSRLLTYALFLTLLAACGADGDQSSKARRSQQPQEGQQQNPQVTLDANLEGEYLGELSTLNPHVVGTNRGSFTFSRHLDQMVVDVRLAGATPDLLHTQYLRTGSRCPTIEDDKNQDGIIDAVEGEAVYGKILVPLDGDLNTQAMYEGELPKANVYGEYNYSKVASFTSFIKDLRLKPGRYDSYAKLAATEPLEIESRVVVIHGITEIAYLPDTVATIGRLTRAQSLPVACATIKKVTVVPGTYDDGTYPGTYP